MVIDYSSQRPVSKNRPRKQPAAFFIVALLVTAGIAYLLGVGTGWLMFGHGRKSSVNVASVNQKGGDTNAAGQTPTPAQPVGKAVEPSLTFYETLPKGNKELMGSGLNLAKPAQPKAPPKTATIAKPAASEETPTQAKESAKPQAKTSEPTPKAKETVAKEGDGKGKYSVQVASYRVKKEAEEARERLKAEGLAAYVVEINIPEKGTYFRVRVGRHLDQQSAHETAEKAGKGAILVPE